MVNSRNERALGRLEGVVSGEVNVNEEHTTSEGGIIWTFDGCLPVIHVFLIK
jgi:hypothetical protein